MMIDDLCQCWFTWSRFSILGTFWWSIEKNTLCICWADFHYNTKLAINSKRWLSKNFHWTMDPVLSCSAGRAPTLVFWFQRQAMTDLMDSPLLAPLADLLTPDKVETLQEMARVFYSNRSDISIARHGFFVSFFMILLSDRPSVNSLGQRPPFDWQKPKNASLNIWSSSEIFTGQGFEG